MGLRKGRVLIPVYRNLSEEIRSESCVHEDTGGGHRASAQALKDCFEIVYVPNTSVVFAI